MPIQGGILIQGGVQVYYQCSGNGWNIRDQRLCSALGGGEVTRYYIMETVETVSKADRTGVGDSREGWYSRSGGVLRSLKGGVWEVAASGSQTLGQQMSGLH